MRHSAWVATIAALTIAAPLVGSVEAQSFASRIEAVRDGTVEFSFATRPGVCGDGRGSVWTNGNGGVYRTGGRQYDCIPGPARVTIGKAEGAIVSVRSCVACRRRGVDSDAKDLGDVSAPDAARYLLRIAKTLGESSAGAAVAAATFADGVDVSPELTGLVRDDDATMPARKDALFWLGQTETKSQDLVQLYATLKPHVLREHFTFVLSQRHDDDVALDKLMDIAQHDSDVQVRKQAMFWLGQSKSPRAIKFFQNILTR